MNINASPSISSFYATGIRQDVAANDIANSNTPGYSQSTAYQVELSTGGTAVSHLTKEQNSPNVPSNTDLATEMVEMKTNKSTYGFNAKVLKVQDRMIGDLIDMVG